MTVTVPQIILPGLKYRVVSISVNGDADFPGVLTELQRVTSHQFVRFGNKVYIANRKVGVDERQNVYRSMIGKVINSITSFRWNYSNSKNTNHGADSKNNSGGKGPDDTDRGPDDCKDDKQNDDDKYISEPALRSILKTLSELKIK